MNVLITGAAGLYGLHMVELFVKQDFVTKVIGVDNFSRQFINNNPFDFIENEDLHKFELLKMDFRDITTSLIDEKDIDFVIHLAAYVSIPESMSDSVGYFENNEMGTFRLLQALFASRKQPFLIYASSPEVYGNPIYTPIKVDHPLYPRSVYAATKLAAEKHCHAMYQWYGYPVTIFRNFNTYGENQNVVDKYAAVIPTFITNAIRGDPLVIHNDGMQTRDFMYVKDAVMAYLLAMENQNACKGEIFNIGTGVQTKILDLAYLIKKLIRTNSSVVFEKGRATDLQSLEADISKTTEKLDWKPKFSLEGGLKNTISWYKRYL